MLPPTFRIDRPTGLWLLAIVIVALALRSLYDTLVLEQLGWLLRPTAWWITLTTGVAAELRPDGSAFVQLGVLLDRSCAGGHFAIVFAAALVFLLRTRIRSVWQGMAVVLLSIAVAVPITIVANVWRVLLSLAAEHLDPTGHIGGTVTLHLFIGAFIQVALLLLAHVLLRPSRASRPRLA